MTRELVAVGEDETPERIRAANAAWHGRPGGCTCKGAIESCPHYLAWLAERTEKEVVEA